MPYPNEHACRLREPSEFDSGSFRRGTREHNGKTYGVIYGKLSGKGAMTEQAYRYPKASWGADEARSHCGRHGGRFEAATGGEKSENVTFTTAGASPVYFEQKEAKQMTKEELKEKHPDVYKAIHDEGYMAGTSEQAQMNLELVEKLNAEKKAAEAKADAYEKELIISRANAIAEREGALVERTMDAILAESSVPQSLFGKVKGQVKYHDFVVSGEEMKEGAESFEKFKAAFTAEVKDWEARLPGVVGGLGLGVNEKTDAASDHEPKSAFGDENLRILGKK